MTKFWSILLSVFTYWKVYIKLQSGFKVKAICCDNATKYKAIDSPILSKQGIGLELTVVYSLWQNGVVEQLNRTLITMARSILQYTKLPI